MPNDDLYQRDGADYTNGVYYPEVDVEQKEEAQTQKAVQATSYPIMNDVADWFQEAIVDCDAISNIEITTMTVNGVKYERSVSVEAQVLAYQLLKQLLIDKANQFGEFGEGPS